MSDRIDSMSQGLLGKMADNLKGTPDTGKTSKAGNAGGSTGTGMGAAGDTVELTSSGKLLERLEKTFASMPEIDRARVDAVKAAIENGDYRVDADRLAEALLYSDLKLGK